MAAESESVRETLIYSPAAVPRAGLS